LRDSCNEVLFKLFSNGNDSGRDRWVYNFNRDEVLKNAKLFADTYNSEVDRWFRSGQPNNIDEFVISDEKRIKWTRNAKRDLKRGRYAEFSPTRVRNALYHPFTHQYLYYGKIFNKEVALFPLILPTFESESENCVICVPGLGNRKRFGCLMTNLIPLLDLAFEKIQCFPFYTYDEDGSNRRENITDWALEQFRAHYNDSTITKWDIFYYVYGILHHPQYRQKYAENLRRELPRIPFVKSPFGGDQGEVFRAFAEAGKQLADLHFNYEEQPEYPLEVIENPLEPLNWRVEKMKLSKDNTQIIYNNFLTLSGIPPEAFEYRLGSRSALEWIIDQYRIKTDKRSGITNDPNREDDPRYIVRLIKKVVTVSVETVKVVKDLPEIGEEASA
jgi:predicted helicase